MSQKSALIVDDSRTARETLRRMLADHELRVETAESAEAALEFLGAHRPDVIFMDHMMPGMDGFQAVKAIKENPATATIPVLMYTSQSGELYVGQARALGAVGVLPKQIKPVEVQEVLRTLHLLPGSAPAFPARRSGDSAGLPGLESVNAPADWSDLHRWLQQMLADQNRALRVDLESTVSRVLGEHLPSRAAVVERSGQVPFWPAGALIVTLAAVAATFVWLHLDSEAKWRVANRQNLGLLAELNARRSSDVIEAGKTVTSSEQSRAGQSQRSAGLAAALEWSVNQGALSRNWQLFSAVSGSSPVEHFNPRRMNPSYTKSLPSLCQLDSTESRLLRTTHLLTARSNSAGDCSLSEGSRKTRLLVVPVAMFRKEHSATMCLSAGALTGRQENETPRH